MKVVRHQTIGEDAHRHVLLRLSHKTQEGQVIAAFPVHRPTVIAAIEHVVDESIWSAATNARHEVCENTVEAAYQLGRGCTRIRRAAHMLHADQQVAEKLSVTISIES